MGIFKAMPEPSSFEESVDAIKQDAAANLNGLDLEELVSNMESSCEFANSRAAGGDTTMPRDHMAVIVLYTCEFYAGSAVYKVINDSLRDADRTKVKKVAPYIFHLMKALEKCPAFEGGKVYRGYKGRPPSGYAPGKTVTWLQFSTAVKSEEALAEMLGGDGERTMFTIQLTTGRARIIDNYSLAPQEMEILLPPNSRFNISAVLDRGDGLCEVHLNEVKPSDPILALGVQGDQLDFIFLRQCRHPPSVSVFVSHTPFVLFSVRVRNGGLCGSLHRSWARAADLQKPSLRVVPPAPRAAHLHCRAGAHPRGYCRRRACHRHGRVERDAAELRGASAGQGG
jgi:hypothetical protein